MCGVKRKGRRHWRAWSKAGPWHTCPPGRCSPGRQQPAATRSRESQPGLRELQTEPQRRWGQCMRTILQVQSTLLSHGATLFPCHPLLLWEWESTLALEIPPSHLPSELCGCDSDLTAVWLPCATEGKAAPHPHTASAPEGLHGAVGSPGLLPPNSSCALRISASELPALGA